MIRYEKAERRLPRQHLYAHLYEQGHKGIEDMMIVKISDKTNESTNR